MAFGLSIDGENTDGTLNFSRCDNATLNLELHPSLADDPVTLYVYDFSINVAGFKRGLSQILYQVHAHTHTDVNTRTYNITYIYTGLS